MQVCMPAPLGWTDVLEGGTNADRELGSARITIVLAHRCDQIGRERETFAQVIFTRHAGSHDGIETEAGFPGGVEPEVEAVRDSRREAELKAGSVFLGPGVVADHEVNRADRCLVRERTLELDDIVASQAEV